jgi:O-antigen/teichoic acid export membrane protein
MSFFLPMEIESRNRVSRALSLLRLKPFETGTAEGLAQERHRRILLSTIASGLAKGISVLAGLIIVPMTLHYLGEERYAVWAMISTLFLTMSSTDLGIGAGVLNLVAAASGKDDRRLIKKYVSSGFFMLLGIGLVMGLIFMVAPAWVPVEKVFNVTSGPARAEAASAVRVVALIYGLGLPLMVVLRFQEGLQEGFYTYLTQMAGNLISLACAFVVIKLELGLPWLVLSLLGGNALANSGAFIFQFYFRKPWACPAWPEFEVETTRRLVKTGGIFFVLTILTLISMQALDPFIVSHTLGPKEGARQVTAYSVVQRLSQVAFLYWAFTQALWPAYAEAITRKDYHWVRKMIRRSMWLSGAVGGALGLVICLFGDWIVQLWVGPVLHGAEGRLLLLSFAVFIPINSVVGTLAVVINGGMLLRQQLVFLLVTTVVAVPLKIILCREWGAAGVVWGSSFAFCICFILPAALLVRKSYWHD